MDEYRYLGPDGKGIGDLPEGVGAAIGSDYCVHLLPTAGRMAELAASSSHPTPLLLLTPYFRDAELKRALPVFRAIPPGADVDVAVNDWGVLLVLHGLFPRMRLSVGRLLSGQKRCPRIGVSSRLTAEGRKWHGEGIFSSARAREHLAAEYGVTGYHLDDLPWGEGIPAGAAHGETRYYLHSPWALVTVSDSCPSIGGVSSRGIACCPRPCREEATILREPSMGAELVLRGKARFSDTGTLLREPPRAEGRRARVLYGEPP